MRTVLVAAFLAASAAALAQGSDIGLVNLVPGDVSYTTAGGSPGKVQAFLRVRDGDRFNLPSGAQLRIVLFSAARQECWIGPASIRAGSAASRSFAPE